MKKLIEKLKNTSIFEINFINISTMLSTFHFEILDFIFCNSVEPTLTNRGLFKITFSSEAIYIDLLFIKFCVFDKTGREFFIR